MKQTRSTAKQSSTPDLFLNRAISIDPGYNTGIAYWNGTRWPETFEVSDEFGKYDFINRAHLTCQEFESVICTFDIQIAVIESIELWSGSAVSHAATSRKSGNTFETSMLIGMYVKCLMDRNVGKIILKTPSQWKGQLDKDKTAYRVNKLNGTTYADDHITDAVGLGFAAVGLIDHRINFTKELGL